MQAVDDLRYIQNKIISHCAADGALPTIVAALCFNMRTHKRQGVPCFALFSLFFLALDILLRPNSTERVLIEVFRCSDRARTHSVFQRDVLFYKVRRGCAPHAPPCASNEKRYSVVAELRVRASQYCYCVAVMYSRNHIGNTMRINGSSPLKYTRYI